MTNSEITAPGAPVPSEGEVEARQRIERVLDYPASFDAATFTEWKRQMAEAVLAALGLEQVGWRGPYGLIPGGMDVDPSPIWEPVYRLRGQQ